MYIPQSNILTDKDEVIEFMKRFSFATIISSKNHIPLATHLPFTVESKDNNIILASHFALANNHWKEIQGREVLTIFREPHAYISPSNYEKKLNVPTWNYIAIHAYGTGELITDYHKVIQLLDKTINNYEKSYKNQWDSLPDDYKLKMSKGIVAFKVKVTDLQAKKKLSQNKTETERMNIIQSLSESDETNSKLIAEYMINDIK